MGFAFTLAEMFKYAQFDWLTGILFCDLLKDLTFDRTLFLSTGFLFLLFSFKTNVTNLSMIDVLTMH